MGDIDCFKVRGGWWPLYGMSGSNLASQKMAWHNRSPSFFPLKVCWYGKCRIDKSDCRRTVFTSEKKMPHVQVSFCFPGGHTVCLHRPTQGWTVGEYILLGKSILASSTVQPWVGRWRKPFSSSWRLAESAEVAFIFLFTNRHSLHSLACSPLISLRLPIFLRLV